MPINILPYRSTRRRFSSADRSFLNSNHRLIQLESFNPRDIAGLQLWLDASQINGLNDGDPVSTWIDLSGNGNDVTQATASKKPTYQTSEINGKPCLRFDGVDDFLINTLFIAAQPLTILCVSKLTVGKTYSRMFDGGASSRLLIGQQGPNELLFYAGSTSPTYIRATPWPWSFYTGIFNGSGSQQFLNGTLLGTADPYNWGLIELRVGCGWWQGDNEFWAGDIAELIIYNTTLSAGNLTLLHAYIAAKYGI